MPTIKLEPAKFNARELKKMPPPETGRVYVYSTAKTDRLGVTITAKDSRTFHIRKYFDGQTHRVSIPGGNLDDMSFPQARRQLERMIGDVAEGQTPKAKRDAQKAAEAVDSQARVTLRQLLEAYIADRQSKLFKPMKESTAENYRKKIKADFSDELDKPAAAITEAAIKAKLNERGARCLAALRVMKAVFKYAEDEGYPVTNPVPKKLPKYGRKTSYLKFDYLGDWFDAVEALDDQIVSQYLQFLVFTGVRADSDARLLDWKHIDWKARSFKLLDANTKNQESTELPLPGCLVAALKQRRQKSGLVFPVDDVRTEREQIGEQIGLPFSRHDLRRTFLTIAEGIDVSWLSVKRLSNHKAQESDVTAGYVIPNLERLRKASKKIEAEIFRLRKDGGYE
jgi:integrase